MPSDKPSSSERSVQGIKWVIIVSAILSSTFLFALDNTVVANVEPDIIESFGEIEKMPWIGAAFNLGGIAILPWGKAYGVFNVKWLYLLHVVLFEAGSALCGASPNMNALIIGRVIAGVGGSGMYVGCITYLAVTTTDNERPMYMGLLGLIWGAGTVLGPVVGGAFADSSATWRWGLYINLVIGAIFAPAYCWLLPSIDFQRSLSVRDKFKQVDLLGIAVFLGAMVSFIMAISFGGNVYAWNSPTEIALWVVAAVLFPLFVATQWFHPFVAKEYRLYPLHFTRRPLLVNLQVQLFLLSGVMLVSAYVIPLFFQFVQGDSSLHAGVRLLPYICMAVVFSLLNGGLMVRSGHCLPWYIFAGMTITIGAALMTRITVGSSASGIYGFTALIGIGVGAAVNAGYPISQSLVDPNEVSNVVGFMSVAQSFGITTSIAIYGSIYQNLAVRYVGAILPEASAAEIRTATAGISSSLFDSLSPATRQKVVEAIVMAVAKVWYLVLAYGVVCFVLSFGLWVQNINDS
ncbi:MFS general substrate transporter [Aspergillus homomorphus CBS 101889]|uniref:MFS general substrate transporter n=1 Tax=Aspergillus homomorphus (strain CBS 101889) TaxID=1450537 RepID=A0A395I2W9_ASPHC|nr:MFS general substrate transporter [Aspergillus homomorphus CBS 101889]RAL14075.1 MFS general substrate transporter [Aspergillus homomorphus CBS 101889]